MFGGCGNCYQDTKETTWKYDTVTDTWTTLADAPGPHNHVFVENGEYFSAFGHVANEGPISYHVPTDTWVEGAPGFPVLQQGHANGAASPSPCIRTHNRLKEGPPRTFPRLFSASIEREHADGKNRAQRPR